MIHDSSVIEVTFFAALNAEADRGAEEKHCSLAMKPGDRIKAALVVVYCAKQMFTYCTVPKCT